MRVARITCTYHYIDREGNMNADCQAMQLPLDHLPLFLAGYVIHGGLMIHDSINE